MIARIVRWSAGHRGLVIAAAMMLTAAGEFGRRSLARDAIPDLSDPQIVIVAEWMDHPAPEVSALVTGVLTRALDGTPGSTAVRGSSMTGMAYVDVVFGSTANLEPGRRAIVERLARVRAALPENVRIQVGPLASSTGWVFQYVLADPKRQASPGTLRKWQDDLLRPALAAISGVAEVASVGGGGEQITVRVRPDQLRARGVAFTDVVSALSATPPPDIGGEIGGGEKAGGHGRRGPGRLAALPVPVPNRGNQSMPRLGDLAHVAITEETPTGLADLDGLAPAVGGIVVVRRDADATAVIETVRATLERLRPRLPPGIRLATAYDRLELIKGIDRTLLRALGEEIAVVVLVILVFLLHGRSALVPLLTLPFVVLLTFAGMWLLRIPATVMSMGGIGIALGMAVDAEVVALEACHRRLESAGGSRRSAIVAAAVSFAPAILTSLLITALSFLPVFAFTDETGRLLRPMAVTKILVVVAAALAAVTLAPALRDRLLVGRVRPEFDNPLTRRLVRIYRPFVQFALRRPALTLITAAMAVISCVPILGRLGGEFLPRFDEGDLLYMPTTMPGVAAGEAAAQLAQQDRALRQFAEVDTVFGKVGRADSATDPAPFSMAETTVRLRPRSEWPKRPVTRWYSSWAPPGLRGLLKFLWPEQIPWTKAELVERLDRATKLPGWTPAWTAPARARMDMMSTGMRTPVGIRIVAADLARLETLSATLRTWALGLSGTRSAVAESHGGETWPVWQSDASGLARHHVDAARVDSVTHLLLTGGRVGTVRASAKSYPIRIGIAAEPDGGGAGANMHGSADLEIAGITVRSSPKGGEQPVPLALLGRISYASPPAMVRTEGGKQATYLYVDLEAGTDVASYVSKGEDALRAALASGALRLQYGERIEWVGQYQLLAAGQRRLTWIAPLVLVAMFGLLLLQFRSVTEALIVLMSVPSALVGSLWTLWLFDYPVSAPVWVGLLSTAGLAMQTGVVMVVYIDQAFHRRVRDGTLRNREDIVAAHAEGTVMRLRPKIMTIATMAAGLLPLLWAEGPGSEIVKRVAAPMLGGLMSSAFLTLEVLPVLYTIWRGRQLRRASQTGQSLQAIVGRAPSWARSLNSSS